MSKKLESIEKKLKKILNQTEEDLSTLRTHIEEVEKSATKSMDHLAQAKNNTDPEAYAKAASEKRAAEDMRQLFLEKEKESQTRPLIGKAEYEALREEIYQEIKDIYQNSKREARKLAHSIIELRDNYTLEIDYANELLHCLQRDIYRMPQILEADDQKEWIADDRYDDHTLLDGLNAFEESYAGNALLHGDI